MRACVVHLPRVPNGGFLGGLSFRFTGGELRIVVRTRQQDGCRSNRIARARSRSSETIG